MLLLLGKLKLSLHKNGLSTKNPYAWLRSIMLNSIIKIFVISFAVLGYFLVSKSGRSPFSILGIVLMYFVYSFVESRILLSVPNN
ncbi:MAG: hypothetical protein QM528_05950 [Phycisphaerales bacterium]|nr:hypothetical protein [Phycisphaerales bacterium]